MKFKKPVKSGLSIIIVGCGKVGNALVRQLSKEGHDITIIDRSREKVMEIANQYDIMGLAGNGASYSVQRQELKRLICSLQSRILMSLTFCAAQSQNM